MLFRHVRIKWIRHGELRSALPNTTGIRRYLRFAGINWSRRKDLHLRSPLGRRVYSASQLLLCHASKKWGLEQELHLRPSPYEGAALTAAPPSRGGPPRWSEAERPTVRLGAKPRDLLGRRVKCSGFCRLRAGGFTIKACDPKTEIGCGRRTRTSIHGSKARCPAVRRHRKIGAGRVKVTHLQHFCWAS